MNHKVNNGTNTSKAGRMPKLPIIIPKNKTVNTKPRRLIDFMNSHLVNLCEQLFVYLVYEYLFGL
ncbi:hypothetical protein JARBOU2352_12080 [Enterococcus faecium]|nr:hypothetical protein EfmAA290_12500 [Enterococcus faecium]BDX40683.1 hypothetical protein K6D_07570 [Enterococcus faecium]GEA71919.1 hypothetical protein ESP02_02890 [Enterococcus sp. NBRC 3427]GER77172.1 hypothetical protein EsFM111_19540 [Enterococcus sp. FM11-1]